MTRMPDVMTSWPPVSESTLLRLNEPISVASQRKSRLSRIVPRSETSSPWLRSEPTLSLKPVNPVEIGSGLLSSMSRVLRL